MAWNPFEKLRKELLSVEKLKEYYNNIHAVLTNQVDDGLEIENLRKGFINEKRERKSNKNKDKEIIKEEKNVLHDLNCKLAGILGEENVRLGSFENTNLELPKNNQDKFNFYFLRKIMKKIESSSKGDLSLNLEMKQNYLKTIIVASQLGDSRFTFYFVKHLFGRDKWGDIKSKLIKSKIIKKTRR